MKRLAKYILSFVFVVLVLGLMQCHVPYFARKVHKGIEKGMTASEVVKIVTDSVIKPTLCHWRHEGGEKYLASKREDCQIPSGIDISRSNVELTILYMGPGFMHNDFKVTFSDGRIVTAITEFRQWD
jgi:hypothetical protein